MLHRCVFCANDTGEIMGMMSADHDLGAAPARPGQTAFESISATAATHYSSGSQLVAYTAAQAARKASPPAYPARWSNATGDWQDLRTLEGTRDQAAEEIVRRMATAESTQLRPTRDYLAMTLIVLPTPAQIAARNAEAQRMTAAYNLMTQLRAKLAAINAATTQAQLDAANAMPPT